jgi:hypothetical protein
VFSVGGGTSVAEARLEGKRHVLRQALKKEYMRQVYNPANYGPHEGKNLFDTSFARWSALQNSTDYLAKRNFRTFGAFLVFSIIPFYVTYKMIDNAQVNRFFERSLGYHGLPWATLGYLAIGRPLTNLGVLDYLWRPWTSYLGLPWATLSYLGLPWDTLGYLGLSWAPWATLGYLAIGRPLTTLGVLWHPLASLGYLRLPWATLGYLAIGRPLTILGVLDYIGLPWESFGVLWRPFWASLDVLELPWASCGILWRPCWASMNVLELPWASLTILGYLWRPCWASMDVLELPWASLTILGYLGRP